MDRPSQTTRRNTEQMRRNASFGWYLALLLVVFLLGLFPIESKDLWWHLRTGEVIWERGEVPQTDWFTYTNGDAAWIDLHWGFQLLLAGLWHLGGEELLVVTKALTGVAAFGLCLSVVRPSWQAVFCWAAPIVLFASRYMVRPEMLSYIFLAATLAVLHLSEKRPHMMWWLPVIQLAWVNTHSLFILQYVVVGAYLFEKLWTWIRTPNAEQKNGPAVKRWSGCVALMLVASLVNPYGVRGLLFPLELMTKIRGADRGFYHLFSSELVGFRDVLAEPYGWAVLLYDWRFLFVVGLFLAGLTTSWLLFQHGKTVSYRVLILCAFAYLAWSMQRNLPLFAIVAGFVLHVNVSGLSAIKTIETEWKRNPSSVPASGAASLILLVLWSIFSGQYYAWFPHDPPRRLSWMTDSWMGTEGIEFLEQPGMPDRIYAVDEGLAARCIYWLGPEKKVFADARLELNTAKTLQEYWDVQFLLPAHDPLAEEYLKGSDGGSLPAVVFENSVLMSFSVNDPPLFQGLLSNEKWRCVYSSAADGKISNGRQELEFGMTIFLPTDVAQQLKLPAVPVSQLLRYTELYAEMVSTQQ